MSHVSKLWKPSIITVPPIICFTSRAAAARTPARQPERSADDSSTRAARVRHVRRRLWRLSGPPGLSRTRRGTVRRPAESPVIIAHVPEAANASSATTSSRRTSLTDVVYRHNAAHELRITIGGIVMICYAFSGYTTLLVLADFRQNFSVRIFFFVWSLCIAVFC